jgi:uroporphyrin-3 C-methyltransferase
MMMNNDVNDNTAANTKAQRLTREVRAAFGIAALACLLTILGFLEAQREVQEIRTDLQRQFADADNTAKQSRALAQQAANSSLTMEGRLSALESHFADLQNQQTSLQSLYQDLARNREDTLLAEVEEAVAVANQQLLLAGDVRLAIRAMENAEKILDRSNKADLSGIKQIIAQDLRRLRAIPTVDLAGMNNRLESLANSLDTLPLASAARPNKPVATSNSVDGFWANLWSRVRNELGDAIRIERADGRFVPPLAADQSFFLRQTVRLRLLTARQALLAHDDSSYRNDLKLARQWLSAWYDLKDKGVQKAVDSLSALIENSVSINVPDVEASLTAIRDRQRVRASGKRS